MTNQELYATKGNRIYFLDNLRTFIIFMVILFHAGGVYEASGFWASFWIVDDPATNDLVWFLNTIIDIFVMPIMFFIAGYLVPMSLKNKNEWAFLKSRFKRLIIPWIIAVLTLIPLYKVIFLYSRNLPQESWTTYFHFSNGNISGQGWLWFLPVLFTFNMLYLLISKTNIRIPNISLKGAVFGTFLIGFVYSVSIGILFGFRNWTHTPLIDFENERLLMYFMIFLLGALSFRNKVFEEKPKSKKLYILVSSTAWIPIMIYIFFLLIPLFAPDGSLISPLVDRLIVWLSFYLSLLCLMYVLIETFWRYIDKTGKIWNELNKNSYGVYIIHVIVLGVIAFLLLNTTIPSLLKYLILAVSTFVVSNLLISFYRSLVQSIKSSSKPETRAAKEGEQLAKN
jgi:surface polysaccharide O-acyltransferase-like enzyme